MNLNLIFKNQKYREIYIFLVFIFSFIYFLIKNYKSAISVFNFALFSTKEKIGLFLRSLFNIDSLRDPWMLILIIIFILTIALFFTLAIALYRNSRELSEGKSVFSTIAIFISILGLSCASCGIGLLASLLSLFGATYLLNYFPLHGIELGYLGVIFLMISNYFLLKRVKSPFTC